eukprot:TRINITY_DN9515_c0_g1_i1.p1 TRINITY_DN9515_c0_g1~~TRINITY_DN9515_c0_g1_i1.p1  ORF type:complete len:224 (+),score=11.49 TRINITY_DN9515_c0_g1_i1:97-672(+)
MEKTTNHSLTKNNNNSTANNNATYDENLVLQLRAGFNSMHDRFTTITENAARYAKENQQLLSLNNSITHQNQELLGKNSYLGSEVFRLSEQNNDLISQIEALKKQNFNLMERVDQLQRDANTRTNINTQLALDNTLLIKQQEDWISEKERIRFYKLQSENRFLANEDGDVSLQLISKQEDVAAVRELVRNT